MELIQNKNNKGTVLWFIKWVSGFLFSFVIATVGMVLFGYETFSFVFVLLCMQVLFWKMLHGAGLLTVLLFDAGFIFLLLTLRLYIVVGPSL